MKVNPWIYNNIYNVCKAVIYMAIATGLGSLFILFANILFVTGDVREDNKRKQKAVIASLGIITSSIVIGMSSGTIMDLVPNKGDGYTGYMNKQQNISTYYNKSRLKVDKCYLYHNNHSAKVLSNNKAIKLTETYSAESVFDSTPEQSGNDFINIKNNISVSKTKAVLTKYTLKSKYKEYDAPRVLYKLDINKGVGDKY